ncbi:MULTISPECIES: hypothetical protein [Aeromonas]|nr:hypothetical protein [Aeromonas veronii]MCJ8213437.1 hypothetical protein [Aeromonas veronii]USP57186.1 hypothetical protein J6598_14490 [Aeromonas veronii]
MTAKTCFVVMAIGEQSLDGSTISADKLRNKYDDLIKEAILRARPSLEVSRADDISLPGTITTDIITRIMHSDYVVVDVTYPNPNVFYELGLRHACRAGTIIIKDKDAPSVPFDIAHLRYIEYENTPSGLKGLAEQLANYFAHLDKDPERPDNHFLEMAKLIGYPFPDYKKAEEIPPEMVAMQGILESPELVELMIRKQSGEEINEAELFRLMLNNPKVAQPFIKAMVKSGDISFGQDKPKSIGSKKRRK